MLPRNYEGFYERQLWRRKTKAEKIAAREKAKARADLSRRMEFFDMCEGELRREYDGTLHSLGKVSDEALKCRKEALIARRKRFCNLNVATIVLPVCFGVFLICGAADLVCEVGFGFELLTLESLFHRDLPFWILVSCLAFVIFALLVAWLVRTHAGYEVEMIEYVQDRRAEAKSDVEPLSPEELEHRETELCMEAYTPWRNEREGD